MTNKLVTRIKKLCKNAYWMIEETVEDTDVVIRTYLKAVPDELRSILGNSAITKVSGGNTNLLYLATHREQPHVSIAIRIYGTGDGVIVDRENERMVHGYLQDWNFSKTRLYEFDGGHIETWIDGRSLHYSDLADFSIAKKIAAKFAVLHSIPKPTWTYKYTNVWERVCINKWIDCIEEIYAANKQHLLPKAALNWPVKKLRTVRLPWHARVMYDCMCTKECEFKCSMLRQYLSLMMLML